MRHATTHLKKLCISLEDMANERIKILIDSNLITAGDVLHGTLSLIGIVPETVDEITLQIRGPNILVDRVPLEPKGKVDISFSVPVPADILHAGVQCRLGSDVFQLYACVRLHSMFHSSAVNGIRYITVKSPGSLTEYPRDVSKYPRSKDISIGSSAFTSVSPSLGNPQVTNKLSLLQQLRSLLCCSTNKITTNFAEPEKPHVLPKLGVRMGYQTAYNVFVFPEFCKFDINEPALSDHDHLLEI